MKIQFTERGWADYLFWQESDQAILRRINALLKEMGRASFVGLGKPEPLRGEFSGWWSRRINREHRVVYRVEGQEDRQRVEILSCRYHYHRP